MLVVGGGVAGSMAAVRAQESGASVVLVEQSSHRPGWGNSVVSGGQLHAVGGDPRADPTLISAKLERLTDGHANPDVVTAWAKNAVRTIEWIESHGGQLVSDPGVPMRAKMFSPVRELVPGLPRGPLGVSNFLTALRSELVRRGGRVRQPARAVTLTRHGNEWSVELKVDGRREHRDAAVVILADGGFQANRTLLRRYVGTDAVRLRATSSSKGDALKMGLSVGAATTNMDGFYGHLLAREAAHRRDLWPYPNLDRLAAVGVVVDHSGRRIVDEGHNGVTTTNAVARSGNPLGYWIIVDDAAWKTIGTEGLTPPNPHLLEHGGTVLASGSLASLASASGIDSRQLVDTVRSVILRPEDATPVRTGHVSLDTPPFHAIPVIAGVTFTLGGLKVDGRSRVLSEDGDALPGLYAAGGTMGGLHGGPRAGYAGGLLEAAIFGLLAGEDGARYASTASAE